MFRRIALLSTLLLSACFAGAQAEQPELFGMATPNHPGRFTIAPGGGETLVEGQNDYLIDVQIWDVFGDPVTTLHATDIWLDREGDLVSCPGVFSQADAGTDASGMTTISGTIFGGLPGDASTGVDCNATELYAYAAGYVLNDGDSIPLRFDSPDLNGDLAVTVADFGMFSADFNRPAAHDPCHDYDEDGDTDVSDFAIFAGYFNQSTCP